MSSSGINFGNSFMYNIFSDPSLTKSDRWDSYEDELKTSTNKENDPSSSQQANSLVGGINRQMTSITSTDLTPRVTLTYTSTASKDNSYDLVEGGVLVRDKTGLAHVTYDREMSSIEQSVYNITIGGKSLIYPIDVCPFKGELSDIFMLGGSHTITIDHDGPFVKITEEDVLGIHHYYIDTKKTIGEKYYQVFYWKPTPMTRENAMRKLTKTLEENPALLSDHIAYNRHGMGLVSFDLVTAQKVFYWAMPEDQELTELTADFISSSAGHLTVKSENYFVDFSLGNDIILINGELATAL